MRIYIPRNFNARVTEPPRNFLNVDTVVCKKRGGKMMLYIALCDDKVTLNNELQLIKDVLEEKRAEYAIDVFNSPKELLQSDNIYNLVFLDIETDEMDGITLAEKISATNKNCLFFFVTNYETYCDNASNLRPFKTNNINTLSVLISSDNKAAQEYIKSIYGEIIKSQFAEYSDNKILNVLLSKKKEECASQGIHFLIDPIRAELSFFNDMDIVTIFSNLINNAMESCSRSSEKKIYLNIHTENENFVVIQIENTSDVKPIVFNGELKTHKDNAKLYGIGMNSIRRALEKYNGLLTWDYSEQKKFFSTMIIVNKFTA